MKPVQRSVCRDLLALNCLATQFEHLNDLFNGQLFGPKARGETQSLENGIDFRLVEFILDGCSELASQKFSSVKEEGTQFGVEKLEIVDSISFLGVWANSKDGRVDFGTGPKNGWG